MPGRGALPKPPGRTVRKRAVGQRLVRHEPAPQPPLPGFTPQLEPWPLATREWWALWGRSALAAEFTEADWAELLAAAVLHARFWSGEVTIAAELRLRMQKFGATPEDRMRLRISWATADELDARRPAAIEPVADLYADLRVVGPA